MHRDENGMHEEGQGEEEADDDLMDKISSSPSIDDGGYPLFISPQRDSHAEHGNGQEQGPAMPVLHRQARDFQNLVDSCATLQSLPPGDDAAHSHAILDRLRQFEDDPPSSP